MNDICRTEADGFTSCIFNESCLKTLSRQTDQSIDLTITSPPYDDIRKYNHLDTDTFESLALELYRVTKQGGVVVWVVGDSVKDGNESGTSFRQALHFKDVGFNLFDTMIYRKGPKGGRGSNESYLQEFEYMFVLSKGRPKTIHLIKDRKQQVQSTPRVSLSRNRDGSRSRQGGITYGNTGRRTNIWHYATGLYNTTSDRIAFEHPAVMPEKLAEDHIISWSNEGDLVYDPFMGSGTTAKMAIKHKRHFLGSELNPDYMEIMRKRLKLDQESLMAY